MHRVEGTFVVRSGRGTVAVLADTEENAGLVVPDRPEQSDQMALRRRLITTLYRQRPTLEVLDLDALDLLYILSVLPQPVRELGSLLDDILGAALGIGLADVDWCLRAGDRRVYPGGADVIDRVDARSVEPLECRQGLAILGDEGERDEIPDQARFRGIEEGIGQFVRINLAAQPFKLILHFSNPLHQLLARGIRQVIRAGLREECVYFREDVARLADRRVSRQGLSFHKGVGSIPSLTRFERASNIAGNDFRELHRHCVAELAHRLRPRPHEAIAVREGLKSRAFPHREIPHRAIGPRKHVLAAGNAVYARLESLGRFVEWTSRVAGVAPRPRLKTVLMIPLATLRFMFGVWKARDGVPNGLPGLHRRGGAEQPRSRAVPIRELSMIRGNAMSVEIVAMHLIKEKRVMRMRRRRE